jgi:hypothetical protein
MAEGIAEQVKYRPKSLRAGIGSDSMYTIIDTFDDFMRCWETAQRRPIAKQIRLWRASYMARFPELLDKQLRNYEDEGFDWRRIARDRVFPHLRERLPLMQEAQD